MFTTEIDTHTHTPSNTYASMSKSDFVGSNRIINYIFIKK